MARKAILTPVLRYWGFGKHPFDDYVLSGMDLRLFVDRSRELRKLRDALSSRLTGTYGVQGVGKSSLLEKLRQEVEKDGDPVVCVQMAGTSEKLLFREILAALLNAIRAKSIGLTSALRLNLEREILRIESSIKHVSSLETGGGVDFVAKASMAATESDQHELPRHTEETALALVARIAEHAKSAFVVIIDNFERAKSLIREEEEYFRFVSRFARIIDERMPSSGVPFVISLDRSFVERIQDQLPGSEEAFSFSFGALISVDVFALDDIWAIIEKRLKALGWKEEAVSFISTDAFLSLMVSTNGHPRRAFAVLREAMGLIAAEKAEKRITADYLRRALLDCREHVDETSLRVMEVLADGKGFSSSDKAFSKAVGVSPSTLRRRLTDLHAKGIVDVQQEQAAEGTARRDIYSLRKGPWG